MGRGPDEAAGRAGHRGGIPARAERRAPGGATAAGGARRLLPLLLAGLAVGCAPCSHGPPEEHVRLVEYAGPGEPGGRRFLVLVHHRVLRYPTGFLNTFPDGGGAKMLRQWVSVRRCDPERGRCEVVARIPIPGDVDAATRFSPPPRWIGERFVVSIRGARPSWRTSFYGDPPERERTTRTFAVTIDGTVTETAPVGWPRPRDRSRPVKPPDGPFVEVSAGWFKVTVTTDRSPVSDGRRMARVAFVLDPRTRRLEPVEPPRPTR